MGYPGILIFDMEKSFLSPWAGVAVVLEGCNGTLNAMTYYVQSWRQLKAHAGGDKPICGERLPVSAMQRLSTPVEFGGVDTVELLTDSVWLSSGSTRLPDQDVICGV